VAKGERFMEFLTHEVEESAAGTQTWSSFGIPTSAFDNYAMLVHLVAFSKVSPERIDATFCSHQAAIATRQPPALDGVDGAVHSDILAWIAMVNSLGQAQGTLSEYGLAWLIGGALVWLFNPPILVATDTLWHGVFSTGGTTAQVSAVRVGYTLEKVTREQFVAALVKTH